MDRMKRATDSGQDQYVLTVFLPLLAVAILACAGGCCYMERRRKRRKTKNGGIDPHDEQQADIDDAASVISTSSTRRRHYLMPTPTTGRLVRGASVRSNYSNFGEPLYESHKREQKRREMRKSYDDNYRNGTRSDYEGRRPSRSRQSGYGERPLTRSRSMTDVRYNADDPGTLRRTRSSLNLNRNRQPVAESGYHDNNSDSENAYEFLPGAQTPREQRQHGSHNSRPPSPMQSEWSVGTAPPGVGYDADMKLPTSRPSSRPSSMVDFPLPEVARERRGFGSRSSLTRSMSQPNLNNIGTKTFPQGILKKVYDNDRYPIVSNQTSSSSDSGIKDIYGEVGDSGRVSRMSQRHTMPNMQIAMDSQRQNSSSMMRYNPHASRPQNYDPYYAMRYGNYPNGMQQQGYSEQPIYSITGNGYQQHPHGGVYGSAYDYAGYHNGYMDHRQQGQRYRTPMY